jgi:hypothetical protein
MEKEMNYAKELYDIIDEFHVPSGAEQERNFLVRYVIYYILYIVNFYKNVHLTILSKSM